MNSRQIIGQEQFEQPSTKFLQAYNAIRFKTLNEAINCLHTQIPCHIRYRLKSFNGKDVHLFECGYEGCKSHILFGSNLNGKKMEFWVRNFDNCHDHRKREKIEKPQCDMKSLDCKIAMQDGGNSNVREIIMQSNIIEYVKGSLRKLSLSMYFRDYLDSFSVKDELPQDNKVNLPYVLPQIVQHSSIDTVIKGSWYCLNLMKKLYLFAFEVWVFDEMLTEVRVVMALKTKNPENYLYTLVLLYILLNGIKSCRFQMEERMWIEIRKNQNEFKKEKDQCGKMTTFVEELEQVFFNLYDCTQRKKESINNKNVIDSDFLSNKKTDKSNQRNYDNRKILHLTDGQSDDEIQRLSFLNNDIKPTLRICLLNNHQKILIEAKQRYVESLYNECARQEKQQWRALEQKPSLIRKLNVILQRQQKKRTRKMNLLKNQSKAKDNNVIELSDSEEEEKIEDQKQQIRVSQYIRKKEEQYMEINLKQMQQGKSSVVKVLQHVRNVDNLRKERRNDSNGSLISLEQQLVVFDQDGNIVEEKPQLISQQINKKNQNNRGKGLVAINRVERQNEDNQKNLSEESNKSEQDEQQHGNQDEQKMERMIDEHFQ